MYVFLDLKQEKLFWNLLDNVSRETLKSPSYEGLLKEGNEKWKFFYTSDEVSAVTSSA